MRCNFKTCGANVALEKKSCGEKGRIFGANGSLTPKQPLSVFNKFLNNNCLNVSFIDIVTREYSIARLVSVRTSLCPGRRLMKYPSWFVSVGRLKARQGHFVRYIKSLVKYLPSLDMCR